MQFEQIEKALQAPTMEAVIKMTERLQTLECNPEAVIYTFFRNIDQTIAIGYSENISTVKEDFDQRGFQLIAVRRGTRREEKLLLLTLKEIGICYSYSSNCFLADQKLILHLNQLGWPMGELQVSNNKKMERYQNFPRRAET